jgi:hypothetical protein
MRCGDRGDEMNWTMQGAGDGEMIRGREVDGILVAGREREGSGMIRGREVEGIRMGGFEWGGRIGGFECKTRMQGLKGAWE